MLPQEESMNVSEKVLCTGDCVKTMNKIQEWVHTLTKHQQCCIDQIYVEEIQYNNSKGEASRKTVICLCEKLPESKLITINKRMKEVTFEDILAKINQLCFLKKSAN